MARPATKRRARTVHAREVLARPEFRAAVARWSAEQDARPLHVYDVEDEDAPSEPPRYASMDEALRAIRAERNFLIRLRTDSNKSPEPDLKDAIAIMVKTVAFTVDTHGPSDTVLTFDYDKQVYTYSSDIIVQYLSEIMGMATRTNLQSAQMSIAGMKRKLAAYNPPPAYKVPVGNGVYNCITGQLEEYDPRVTVTDHIDTDFDPESVDDPGPSADGHDYNRLCSELANFLPDRVQLIRQICTSIVTGHAPAPSLFIVVGRGGDGKSTFFQLLVNTIGRDNTAFVNFSELASEDKMVETIGKRLVLGMDNDVSLYIRSTAKLKSMAAREYLTHSRKYQEAVSAKFSGAFVQLCNEMPRFAETGASMARRIVGFRAENSHYVIGDEDRGLNNIIEKEDFKKHVLSSILTGKFYSDFNDVDRDMVRATLDTEDILAQFTNELSSVGALCRANEQIPANHLYAVYRDWMKTTNPTSSPLSSRAFTAKISGNMDAHGYVLDDTAASVHPSSLIRAKLYSPGLFGTYADGEELARVQRTNASSRVFELRHKPNPEAAPSRRAVACSPLEYFGVLDDFTRWLANEDAELHAILTTVPDDADQRADEKAPEVTDAPDHVTRQRNRATERRDFRDSLAPPVDLRYVHRNRDRALLADYASWLRTIGAITPADNSQEVAVFSVLDQAADFAKQVGTLECDGELVSLAQDAGAQSAGHARMVDRLEEFADLLDEKWEAAGY